MNALQQSFDYDALDAETRIVVRQKTGEIRERMKRAAEDIQEIGERLIVIKEHLGHGNFGKWLDVEFGWSESSALRVMQVAEAFKSVTVTDLNIGAKSLYVLAAPSTPEPVRAEIIAEAQTGKPITHAEVKARVQAARPGWKSVTKKQTQNDSHGASGEDATRAIMEG